MHSVEVDRRKARFIPIFQSERSRPPTVSSCVSMGPESAPAPQNAATLTDRLHRPLRDLRISITDQCNFRCRYCMPKEHFGKEHVFLPRNSLLDFDAMESLVRTAIGLGVRKVRLTGGEPLLRKGVEGLVARLAALRTVDGQPLEVAMTTNGSLLRQKAAGLKAAGLARVTVSLDALDDLVFQRINDAGVSAATVLEGIAEALRVGFQQVKVNVVVRRGWNEDQILPLARHFAGTPVILRFIEFMDVGRSNAWSPRHVVPCTEVLDTLRSEFDLARLDATSRGETAQRWSYAAHGGDNAGRAGELGLIGSVTTPFCGDCNRARITADGKLFTCLFAQGGFDLMPYLRAGQGSAPVGLAHALAQIWRSRDDRYSEMGRPHSDSRSVARAEMNYLGG